MVLDPRKRQKKLERKTAKRKAQLRAFSQRNPTDMSLLFQKAATAPVLHSFASSSLWKEGIGYVMLSREFQQSQLAYAVFLVDTYCLGVKNALWDVRTRSDVNSLAEKLSSDRGTVKLKPECVRNLVEGAVEYDRDLGFAPHHDYQRAKLIFGDINGAACTEKFVYGRDGKPLFIAGPHDSQQRCRQIVNSLSSRLGPQGYDFIVPVLEGDLPEGMEDMDDGVWDEDDQPADKAPARSVAADD